MARIKRPGDTPVLKNNTTPARKRIVVMKTIFRLIRLAEVRVMSLKGSSLGF